MPDINPLQILQDEAQAEVKARLKYAEIERQLLVEDFTALFKDLPEVIKKRGYVDCRLMKWGDEQYAGVNLQFNDIDYRHFGLNIQLLFNAKVEHIFIADAYWRYSRFNDGKVVDDAVLAEILQKASLSTISETIGYMTVLSESAEDETLERIQDFEYFGPVHEASRSYTKSRGARVLELAAI